MAEEQAPPLAIIAGASAFPRSPRLWQGKFFLNSAEDIRRYLEDARGLSLPADHLLWLFNSPRSPSEQLLKIAEFLAERAREEPPPLDLLIFYVGHGFFGQGADQAYRLAVKFTSDLALDSTSIRVSELAQVVKAHAMLLRRYVILDCCFAGSALREFQSGPLAAATVQVRKEFPARGTALLCASNAHQCALAPEGASHTMFSAALIQALRSGHQAWGSRMSFSELGALVRENIRTAHADEGVRPEIHSPDQREGDIASLPLFPNPAFRRRARPATNRAISEEGRLAARERERPGRAAQRRHPEPGGQNRPAAQEAAADQILKQSRRKREQRRLARKRAAEKWAEKSQPTAQPVTAVSIVEKPAPEKQGSQKLEIRAGAPAPQSNAVRKEAARPAPSSEADTVSGGALIVLLLITVPLVNVIGYFAGGYWAAFSHFLDRYSRDISTVASMVAGLILGAGYAEVAAVVDPRFRYGSWACWPGFLVGFEYRAHLPPGHAPQTWPALTAVVVFLVAAFQSPAKSSKRP